MVKRICLCGTLRISLVIFCVQVAEYLNPQEGQSLDLQEIGIVW